MTKPKVRCCNLRSATGAGRLHWFHADTCPEFPGKEIGKKRRVPPKIKAIVDHPSVPIDGGNRAVAIWAQHGDGCPGVPEGALCAPCANVNFWLDRDDDWEAVDA